MGRRRMDRSGMDLRGNPKHEATGEAPIRLDPLFRAHLQEHLEGGRTFPLEFGQTLPVEVRAAVQSQELPAEFADLRVEKNAGLVLAEVHRVVHGGNMIALSAIPLHRFGVRRGPKRAEGDPLGTIQPLRYVAKRLGTKRDETPSTLHRPRSQISRGWRALRKASGGNPGAPRIPLASNCVDSRQTVGSRAKPHSD